MGKGVEQTKLLRPLAGCSTLRHLSNVQPVRNHLGVTNTVGDDVDGHVDEVRL
jgi:hypothetical protein